MEYIRGTTDEAVQAVAARLIEELGADKRVLWLVCGGSNIAAEAAAMRQVATQAETYLRNLTILPTDERYGAPGHADSNYRQLRDAGFEPGPATWTDVLARDLSLDETVAYYADLAAAAFASADVIIAQFGIGPDGHIAGILPDSPAALADEATVAGYEWRDFTRLTLTYAALCHVHIAYALAYGDTKREALERLQRHTEPFAQLPSELLYDIAEAQVYTDLDIAHGTP